MVHLLRVTCGAVCLLVGAMCSLATAAEPAVYPSTGCPSVLPDAWQPPVLDMPDEVYPEPVAPLAEPTDAACVQPPLSRDQRAAVANCSSGNCQACSAAGLFGMTYDDWLWGCGGWPFQTGPGCCDTWKVGPVWHVAVDGMTLFHKNANLAALKAAAQASGAPDEVELREQFGYGGGGRVFALGTLPRWECYQLQFGYEGIEEWNAELVFPKVPAAIPGPPPPDLAPSERRTIDYCSSWHSAEFNFSQATQGFWTPFAGIRYMRFRDELTDLTQQAASPPLPDGDPVTTTDTLNLFDVRNQLIGLQIGARRDLWQICQRFTLQGFINSGVYYNNAQRFNRMALTTTERIPDNLVTADINEARTAVSTASNAVSSQVSNVAYAAEASLTGVCRLNKCVALRGGYQFLWVQGVRMAENAYLGSDLPERQLTFQGWHVGVEYRR